MFKREDLVITQYEHSRLAGFIAANIDNKFFASQEFKNSFIKAVFFHDRGFGTFDNLLIGEMPEDKHIEILMKSFYQDSDDKVCDLLIKYHVRRLTTYSKSEKYQVLFREFDEEIKNYENLHNFNSYNFEQLDLLMDFCDSLSFDYCFGNNSDEIFPAPENLKDFGIENLRYIIDDSTIYINTKSAFLKSNLLETQIISYKSLNFPDKLNPAILSLSIENIY